MMSCRSTTRDVCGRLPTLPTHHEAQRIGVSGRLEGNVLYGFSGESAQSIVGVMLGEPVSTVNDELALSAIGEIGNMITGNAAARLA